jgi:hypothetical protein
MSRFSSRAIASHDCFGLAPLFSWQLAWAYFALVSSMSSFARSASAFRKASLSPTPLLRASAARSYLLAAKSRFSWAFFTRSASTLQIAGSILTTG